MPIQCEFGHHKQALKSPNYKVFNEYYRRYPCRSNMSKNMSFYRLLLLHRLLSHIIIKSEYYPIIGHKWFSKCCLPFLRINQSYSHFAEFNIFTNAYATLELFGALLFFLYFDRGKKQGNEFRSMVLLE